jgi:hypothetical protein
MIAPAIRTTTLPAPRLTRQKSYQPGDLVFSGSRCFVVKPDGSLIERRRDQ